MSQDDIIISLQVAAQFSEPNSILKGKIDGKEFDLGEGRTVTVEAMEVSAYGSGLIVKLDFKAKLSSMLFNNVRGTLYLVGIPKYDDTTSTLSFSSLAYEANTNSALLDSAAALMNLLFIGYLDKKLVFNLSKKVAPLRDQIKAGIHVFPLVKGVNATVTVSSFEISNVFVATDSLGIVTNVKGKAQINVTECCSFGASSISLGFFPQSTPISSLPQ